MESKMFLSDCLDGMKSTPDGYYDLAIVDPPYGGGGVLNGTTRSGDASEDDSRSIISAVRTGGTWARKYQKEGGVFSKDIRHWDHAPPPEYFQQLFRVSKNQIICGGNYFSLPPTRCFVVWNKPNIAETFSMAMCEYFWTSYTNRNAKIVHMSPQGSCTGEKRIHPTQKPVKLYEKLLTWFANPGDRILDTHAGSQSSRIACYNLGFDYVGYEIDPTYFELGSKRFEEHTTQLSMFVEGDCV